MYQYSNYTLSSTDSTYDYGGNTSTYANTPRTLPNTSNMSSSATSSEDDDGPGENTAGMIVLPDNTRIFVNNKAAYFAAHPEARASTEASLKDFKAWNKFHTGQRETEVWEKFEKKRKRDEEMEAAGCHGCVDGKGAETCCVCGGHGRGSGKAEDKADDRKGRCKNCDGNGVVLFPCEKCKEQKRKEKASKKGGWSKGPVARRGPVCDEGN